MAIAELENKLKELEELAKSNALDLSQAIASIQQKIDEERNAGSAWKKVELARHPNRPGAQDYINLICDEWMELCGDRLYGEDPAIIGGIGRIGERYITFIGNRKGKNLKENIRCNHGCAHPEGYRKAQRLALQAERFGRPIITFIDTMGAYPGMGAEERGIGEAIAQNLRLFAGLKTPIICFVIGEGGSGGALGIGVGDKIYMLENAIYSVISPEGFASILLRDASKARDASNMMRLTSQDLLSFKILNGIIPEPQGGAHTDPGSVAALIKARVIEDLDKLENKNAQALVRFRRQKIRSIGHYTEARVSPEQA
jgi:acetyl-CoA carboxylase carboxyl transferase subunit alpha